MTKYNEHTPEAWEDQRKIDEFILMLTSKRVDAYLTAKIGEYVNMRDKEREKLLKKKKSIWDLGTGGGEDDAFSLASIQDANM